MARGSASGHVTWGGQRYEFQGAPAYSEKNWGAGFPKKWWWVQAEAFRDAPHVALTAVGATLRLRHVGCAMLSVRLTCTASTGCDCAECPCGSEACCGSLSHAARAQPGQSAACALRREGMQAPSGASRPCQAWRRTWA